MKTFAFRSLPNLPQHTHFTKPSANPTKFTPPESIFHLKNRSYLHTISSKTAAFHGKTLIHSVDDTISSKTAAFAGKTLIHSVDDDTNSVDMPLTSENKPRWESMSKRDLCQVSSNGHSRFLMLGAASLGLLLLAMGMDDQKAFALGPEGPLVEEFWDNVRRYALYALTVSTGALYTIFQPIVELLKNPISAILVLVIFGGSFYIVSQVLYAMVGVSEFSYDYGY